MPMPRSLFARTALLITATIIVFAVIAWQAIIWTALVPASDAAASLLTERAHAALTARRAGELAPEGTRFESGAPPSLPPRRAGLALRTYVERVRNRLALNLGATDVRIERYAAPAEIWLRTPQTADAWLVLTWRLAGPGAPLATLLVWGAAAGLALGAAALSARRLAAPLAQLAGAAARLAEGERVPIDTGSGPREVRALAAAFQSMSQRLAELDEQRELMLGGISHDLRTPLARLRVAVELLDGADAALTREMTANVEEMDRMIGQFLHYARAGYRELPGRASLDAIVGETLRIYATDERVRLEAAAAETRLLAVDGVRRLVLNLVQNALDYGRPPVTVRTFASATDVAFEVSDRGAGLSAEQWAEALKPFQRLRAQPAGSHAGLGLALVDRLVRACGGSLQARQLDGGFAVMVRLPAPPPAPAGDAART
jgi:two-component system, OmpR family, osmolarity sensor histidine kinase EnvZ